MNYEKARHHMIEQQLRPWEVLDPAVIDSLYADRRELFVPEALRAFAFADVALPLPQGAQMLPPKLEAHCLQALALQPHERVLEIGTGSGHMAALLGRAAHEVWSVEIDPSLAELARANLARAGIDNVSVIVGDGLLGLADGAPYDAILVSGGIRQVPSVLIDQLAAQGRLLAFVGASPVYTLRKMTKHADGVIVTEDLLETDVPALRQPAFAAFDFSCAG
ncbi:MAG: protein-L-isoaspartate O-methyltransferase [Rhodocyclaceae bacterium]|nr:protein-L-isoaspartate O-methyltransferase [Rhodocyclaceae bacterium]